MIQLEEDWNKMETNIIHVVNEALSKRNVNINIHKKTTSPCSIKE